MPVIGSEAWLAAVCDAVNDSATFRDRARGWDEPVGLGFEQGGVSRYALLQLAGGTCREAEEVDEAAFHAAAFRISGPLDRWERVLTGGIDPLRCLMLHRLELVGDPLRALKFLPAAKALLAACLTVEATVPSRT